MSVSLGLVHQDRAERKQSTATANLKGLREEESPNSGSPQDRSLNPVATGTGSITSHTTTSPAPAPVPAPATPSPTSPTPKPTLPRKKSLSIMSMSMSAFTSTASSSSTRSSDPSIKSTSKSSESSSSKPPPPRPRSPPSMYHMYAMDAPRAPKPLVKLPSKSKEGKGKADNHNGSTSTLGTISSFGSHRSSKDKDKGKGKGTGSTIPSIIPAKFGFRRTSSVGRMQAPTPNQNQNQNQDSHNHDHHSTAQPQPPESGTPLSPAFPVQSEEEIRKKRIERVERTFGEHVPTELVFPGPGDLPQQHQHQERLWRELDLNAKDLDRVYRAKQEGKAVRRASISVATFASLRKRAAGSIASTRTHSRGSSGTSDSHDHEFVPTSHSEIMEERRGPAVPSKTGTTNSVPRPRPLPPVPTGAAASGPRASNDHPHPEAKLYQDSPRTEPVRFQPRQSSLIARTKSLSSHPSLPFAIDASLSLPRPSSPFVDNLVPIPRSQSRNGTENGLLVPPGMELVEGTVVRRERKQGWSGEWNRDDMQDVIQKLRALK